MNSKIVEVGNFTYGHEHIQVMDYCDGGDSIIRIGAFCSISAGCQIFLMFNHDVKRVTTYPFGHIHTETFPSSKEGHPISKGDVVIQNDVWIARGVTIMSGVTIGNGAVIAANSHVITSVEPYSIVGGNPAKRIKYRFSSEQIADLLRIRWWDWDVAKIQQNIPLLCSHDIDSFIDIHS